MLQVSQDVTRKTSVSLFNIDNFNNYIVVIM